MKKEQGTAQGTVMISYDPARLQAIYMYAKGKGCDVNRVLTDTLDKLFARFVPPSVQEYLSMTSGETDQVSADESAPQ
ncbi:MAG: hypothetical protein II743_01275 [Lachnospiraceae bacterium]|nr:hypothetical protein [Lachnospiraceae bacterium]